LNGLVGRRDIHADVCIVGGGMAGLLIAKKLHEAGVQSVVLESGDLDETAHANRLNDVANAGRAYIGATVGRSRRLGGTSSLWGGSLIPFFERDFGERSHIELPSWPIGMADIAEEIHDVEDIFGVTHAPYDQVEIVEESIDASAKLQDDEFVLRCAKWPKFGRLNLAHLWARDLKRETGIQAWINATVTAIEPSIETGSAGDVVARSAGGAELRVAAKHIVLCGGVIETTRLLLLFDRHTNGAAFHRCRALGRYFFDHLSLAAAELRPRDRTLLNRMAGYRWEGNTMRSLRFEFSPAAQVKAAAPSCFGHISIETKEPTPLDVLRNAFRGYQKAGRVKLNGAETLFKDLGYLLRAGVWRALDKRLLWPDGAKCNLHIVAEQVPQEHNSISLSEECDYYGVPRARIDWSVSPSDMSAILAYARSFDGYWRRTAWSRTGDLHWNMDLRDRELDARLLNAVTDIYHPGGTTRMGTNATDAVVDRDLNVFAIPNLSIASASVFPAGPSANPSLTLMALSVRLAKQLANKFGKA
jgi:choline dehydrogenase-like flavoprotein